MSTTEAVPFSSGRRRSLFGRYWQDERLATVGAVLLIFVILLVLVGPFAAPYDPNALGVNIKDLLAPPSAAHWMGTDQFGRDYFSRWLYAGRVSLLVAGGSVAIALVVGGLAGLIAGYKNGTSIDAVVMRGVDAILSIPSLVLVIAVAGTLGSQGFDVGSIHIPETGVLILVLAIIFMPLFARIARASALAEMQEDYIFAARAIGMRAPRILFANLLPNVVASLVIQASFTLALAISAEATVSFLGFGIQPPQASWGNLLNGSRDYLLQGKWWLVAFPVAIIIVAVFAFNLVGDGLRDILDPKRRLKMEER